MQTSAGHAKLMDRPPQTSARATESFYAPAVIVQGAYLVPFSNRVTHPRNRLLAALPPESLDRLWPHLRLVEIGLRQIVQLPEQPVGTVHFPETCWFSCLAPLDAGESSEVGLIGHEGVTALPVILGDDRDDVEVMAQCPGTAYAMGADALRSQLDRDAVLRRLLLRYVLVHHGQVARTAACNGRHHIEQRLARWLLMSHDRIDGDEFPITHEFMGMMLGVRRGGITIAAGVLQKAGLIHYRSGHMTITNRAGLEAVSCEYYGYTRRASDRMLGQPMGTSNGERRTG